MAYKNSEGYPDPTAGRAIANAQRCIPGHIYQSYAQNVPIVAVKASDYVMVGYRIETFLPYENESVIKVSDGVVDPWRIINMSNIKADEDLGLMSDEDYEKVLKGFAKVCQLEIKTVVDDRAEEIAALEENVSALTEAVHHYQMLYEESKAEAERIKNKQTEVKIAPEIVNTDALIQVTAERDVYKKLFMDLLSALLKPEAK